MLKIHMYSLLTQQATRTLDLLSLLAPWRYLPLDLILDTGDTASSLISKQGEYKSGEGSYKPLFKLVDTITLLSISLTKIHYNLVYFLDQKRHYNLVYFLEGIVVV